MSRPVAQRNLAKKILALFRIACRGTSWIPEVLAALWCHETGWGTSEAWTDAINPGGIKSRKGFFVTAAFGASRTGLYARYPNSTVATVALVLFLQQRPRYDRARVAVTPELQLKELARAGYVGGGTAAENHWIERTTAYLEELRSLEP